MLSLSAHYAGVDNKYKHSGTAITGLWTSYDKKKKFDVMVIAEGKSL